MFPAGKLCGAKVAFSPGPATKMPRQFGPISRAPWARTRASSCSCLRIALDPGLGEAGGDHAERARALPHRRLGLVEHRRRRERRRPPGRRLGDVRDRAVGAHAGRRRSLRVDGIGDPVEVSTRGCCGRARRRSSRAASTRRRRRPSAGGRTVPAKPRRRGGRARRRPRGSWSVGAISSRTSVVPPSILREMAKPASAKTRSIGALSGMTSATKVEMPALGGRSASCSSSRVPTPCPCSASATANATSAHARVAQPHVVGERDDVLGPAVAESVPISATAVVPVRLEERLDRRVRTAPESRGSAGRRSARRAARRSRGAPRRRPRAAGGAAGCCRCGG